MELIASGSGDRSMKRDARIAPLAVLPVFFDLTNKPVVVVGGSDAAAWKAHLLKSAGAHLTVIAEILAPAYAEIFTPGDFIHRRKSWVETDLLGAELVIADIEDVDDAEAFYAAARRVGVPVNVIDKPAFCQFQFGSIVNRSPLVVGISTNGAAPILGQAVRRRIETLLPHTLAAWAGMAKIVRQKVMDTLAPGPARRAFWERFADAAFSRSPSVKEIESWLGIAPVAPSGRVTLVGAGPGDAEYLTIKAVRALQSADVILFDDLVSAEVLELARREARRLCVGKRGGQPSCKQDDINAMMVSLAKKGRHVVRLKSGDPMIFGRGGEEIARLEQENIAVDVVPGITTALALAAELKLSLTHRDCAQSVRFVTGHARSGELPGNLDWKSLSDPATTHIYYMAGRTASAIGANLTAAGMPLDTPVVIARNVSRRDASYIQMTLSALREQGAVEGAGPVLVAVGNALAARQATSAQIAAAAV